jgi:hypothetical protein
MGGYFSRKKLVDSVIDEYRSKKVDIITKYLGNKDAKEVVDEVLSKIDEKKKNILL